MVAGICESSGVTSSVIRVSTNYFKYIALIMLCVHKYLTVCKTNPQPPGIADFLRGTVALFYYSKQYNYEFYIDGTHPLFSFLQPNNKIVKAFDLTTHELIWPIRFNEQDAAIQKLFEKKENFTVLTHCPYQKIKDKFNNYGPIRQDARGFLQDILKPNEVIQKKISFIFETVYKINPASKFKVIHLRFGDKFINTIETIPAEIYLHHYIKVLNIISCSKEPIILMSDATMIARKLKKDIPQLLYWDNHKIHLGSLDKDPNEGIIDTLADFFIMSKANEIYSAASGFAAIISEIYSIKYISY
jgi:hypothetical protein